MQFAVMETPKPPADPNATPAADNRTYFIAIAVLALVGIALSAVSLQRHYATSASKFCDFAEKFNCDIVNRSEFSTFMGLPVAGIGVVGYGVLFALSAIYRSRAATRTFILAAALAGLVFALYLSYVEGFILDTWCVLCLGSLATITCIAAFSGIINARSQ
jgi:vitamin-K-epoxide reductase (warfarin-sensitive)